jgi:GntR family carbon starvation induced transcriptional regulator
MALSDVDARVSRATLALQLEDALRADILSGELRPGQRLRAADIAPRYGVSATPLREALQRLAVEGLVVQDARIGVRVSLISRDDLRDVYETRVVLESEALRRSIARGDGAWLGRVAVSLEDLRRVTPRTELSMGDGSAEAAAKAWSRAHREFDLQLYSACGSPWLLRFIETLSKRCERYRRAAGQLANAYAPWLQEHEDLYQAIRARNETEGVTVLQRHLRGTEKMVEDHLRESLSES